MATTMPDTPPNILFIMADQLVPFLTAAYDHPVVQTPDLARLAAEGVRFDAAYSPSPVCGPARSCLMTGQYASTIGAWDNATPLPCDQPTFAHYLALGGYDTVLAGKMHFVGPDQLHGYDRRFNTNLYPADFAWTPVRGEQHASERSHALQYQDEAVHVDRWNQYLSYDEEAHFRSLEYLRARALDNQARRERGEQPVPFFLTVSYHHPHEPFWPPQVYWDRYADAPIALPAFPENLEQTLSVMDRWLNHFHGVARAKRLRDPESLRHLRRAYYALVSYIDDKVGDLLAELERSGLAGNTVVIFASDHGDMLAEKGMVQKRTFYEWSSRVPLIVRLPDRRQAGTVRAQPVNLIDLLPTFLELAGVGSWLPVDGRSLLPLLNGDEQPPPGKEPWETFSEYHSQGVHAPCFMLRRGWMKYIYIHGHDEQLFNLDEDPGEWHNLAREPRYREQAEEMRASILARFDPERIDAAVNASIARRTLIRQAMRATGTRWDAEPRFDALRPIDEQYLP
jgi:choline-sulfatase